MAETPRRKPPTAGERKAGVATMASGNMPTSASGPRDTADPVDTLASMEARLARLQARLDELDADVERQRREKKEPDIEIAIRKGTLVCFVKFLWAVSAFLLVRLSGCF